MKLTKYLKKNNITKSRFAKCIGLTRLGLINIINECNKDMKLSTAFAIEVATQGQVKMYDLLPEKRFLAIEKFVADNLYYEDIEAP